MDYPGTIRKYINTGFRKRSENKTKTRLASYKEETHVGRKIAEEKMLTVENLNSCFSGMSDRVRIEARLLNERECYKSCLNKNHKPVETNYVVNFYFNRAIMTISLMLT